MCNIFNKHKHISNPKLVGVSLLVFIVFTGLVITGIFLIRKQEMRETIKQEQVKQATSSNKYVDVSQDPFITVPKKVEDLEDLQEKPTIQDHNPVVGDTEAPLSIFYFSDYNCKYCYEQEKILKQVVQEHPNKVNVVWKDYPAFETDSSSWQFSLYAKCAQEQDKYWEFHDLLQSQLQVFKDSEGKNISQIKEFLNGLSQQSGLDRSQLNSCIDDKEVKTQIQEDIAQADKLDIVGVPFLYIQDEGFLGKLSKSKLDKIIKSKLNE